MEVISFESLAEVIRTVTNAQSWGEEFWILENATEKLQAPNVHASVMVKRLVMEDLREQAAVWKCRRECK